MVARAQPMRRRTVAGLSNAAELRAALAEVPASDRDAWVDSLLGLNDIPADGPDLPAGGVPYLPCSVTTLLQVIDLAEITAEDVFVDVGAGVGRATMLVHLLTGASAIGVEVQQALVVEAQALASAFEAHRVRTIHGDAAAMPGSMTMGTVFFLYCPFSGDRLLRVLQGLEDIAASRVIRICCVDLPLPPQAWLEEPATVDGLAIYRSRPPNR